MKTTLRPLILAAIGVTALTLGSTRLRAEQPEMSAAIENLEKAKHSEHPIEHLERAKHELEDARHNKHGERAEAIKQVEAAIFDAKKGEHRRMEEHIERAIHEVREGRRDARR